MATKTSLKVEIGKVYTFSQLELFLFQDKNRNKFLKLLNIEYKEKAIMHVFFNNFHGDWKSGDGILFYEDGETHSADEYDEFEVLEILSM